MPAKSTPVVHRLCAALLVALAAPVAVQAQEASTTPPSVKTLDQITVTGSRIRRADAEESLPITSFSKEQIDAAGISSAEQLLAQLNIAGNGSDNLASNGGIVSEEQRGNNGVSGANLRGQGADATLVLLTRNFGAFAAVRAGLEHARGEHFAVMAADLQEPPELVLQMQAELARGAQRRPAQRSFGGDVDGDGRHAQRGRQMRKAGIDANRQLCATDQGR